MQAGVTFGVFESSRYLEMATSWFLRVSLISILVGSLASSTELPFPSPRSPSDSGKTCLVKPLGSNRDDVPQILNAFEDCNNGGTVFFPEGEEYYIATRLNPVLRDVVVEWRGTWVVWPLALC